MDVKAKFHKSSFLVTFS